MSEARKFPMYSAEDVFDFLSYNDTISLDHLSETGKASLKMRKFWNLILNVRNLSCLFRNWLSRLDSLKAISRCLGTLVRTISDQQQLYKESRGCLTSVWRFGRRRSGLCLAWLHCLVHSSHLQGLVHPHLYCCTSGDGDRDEPVEDALPA